MELCNTLLPTGQVSESNCIISVFISVQVLVRIELPFFIVACMGLCWICICILAIMLIAH